MNRIERIGLIILAAFSAMAVAGYWFFGLHPENLARFPSSAGFYAHSFRFFAQTQVWLSGLVLVAILAYRKRMSWIPGLVTVYILSLASELAGTTTGFPFGAYQYTDLLGTKWFGHVPYLIPLSWFTMALPSFVLVERTLADRFPKLVRWLTAAALLTSWDLVLDPAMSFLVPYWQWGQSGAFYGMPFVNLLGWFFTGFVLAIALGLLNIADKVRHVSSRTLLTYYAIVYALPAGMLFAAGHVVLVVLTTAGIFGSMFLVHQWSKQSAEAGDMDETDQSGGATLDGRLAEIADRTGQYFEQHSRSFSFASGFFLPADRVRVCRLYAFCRMSDDIADEGGLPAEERKRMLGQWRTMVLTSFHGTPSGIVWLDTLMSDLREGGLRAHVLEGLLDAVESDIDFRGIRNQDELEKYAYGVASTVGIMMCHLFGETDPWKLERAASLGLAMQLTNIQRDIGQDLKLGRVYLPASWLSRYGVRREDLALMQAGQPLTDPYRQMMADLEGYANLAYCKAWEAIPALGWRFGPSVAIAADVYHGIHAAIARNGGDNLTRRAYTSTPRKLALMLGALMRFGTGRLLLALQSNAPASAARMVRTALEKARMTWVVPFVLLFIHAAILAAN